MKIVVFVDALDENDLSPWFKEHLITSYNPGVPKVTPNVVSQIMTGNRQEDMRFVRSTKYRTPQVQHLTGKTILHYSAIDRNLKTFQFGIPLCSRIQLPQGSMSVYDHLVHGNQIVPNELTFYKERMNFLEGDYEFIFDCLADQTSVIFSTLRGVARNGDYDVMFIGYTFVDALTHWYNSEIKKRLVYYLETELKDLNTYGDILFFSDHGSTKQTDVFFINQWLREKGYLSYDIYEKLLNFHRPPNAQFPDQLNFVNNFTYIDFEKSKFFCVDAFDSMIDATESATKEDTQKLKRELMETGYFDKILLKSEIFDKHGECYKHQPDVMPDCKEGVIVSCNIHPRAEIGKNMDNLRGGWHSNRAVVGSTDKDLKTKIDGPRDIYYLLKEFIDKENPKENRGNANNENVEMQIAHLMEQLRYTIK